MAAHDAAQPAEPDFDDLTARARIRDAAIRLFADRGINGATVRDIAKAAGVSPGLVRHHFGAKEGLRDACDHYALERTMRIKEQVVIEGKLSNPMFMSSVHPTVILLRRYIARSMLDGSAAAGRMFEEMVTLTEAWLATHQPVKTEDPRAFAAVLVAMSGGLLTMQNNLSDVLGDVTGPAGFHRMSLATLEVMSQPLVDPALLATAKAALAALHTTSEGAPQ